jgi:serine/threonine-protein kinase HipA
MTDILVVVLDDVAAGTLTRLPGGRLRFDYDDEYRGRRNSTPLSISMPTQVRSHSDRAITPWLWGLLPDNTAVLARWARDFHASASSPFSMLATPIGHDCAGAVRFAAPDDVDEVLGRPGDVTWLTDEQVAARLRGLREDATAWLGREFTGQFSLAGASTRSVHSRVSRSWRRARPMRLPRRLPRPRSPRSSGRCQPGSSTWSPTAPHGALQRCD